MFQTKSLSTPNMLVATALISTLLTPRLVLANPVSLEDRAAIEVGYGQQIQLSDETNHWVVWVEEEDACPATQTLSVLTSSPCEQTFSLAGGSWKLTNCNEYSFSFFFCTG